jgi:hypothetical protein
LGWDGFPRHTFHCWKSASIALVGKTCGRIPCEQKETEAIGFNEQESWGSGDFTVLRNITRVKKTRIS